MFVEILVHKVTTREGGTWTSPRITIYCYLSCQTYVCFFVPFLRSARQETERRKDEMSGWVRGAESWRSEGDEGIYSTLKHNTSFTLLYIQNYARILRYVTSLRRTIYYNTDLKTIEKKTSILHSIKYHWSARECMNIHWTWQFIDLSVRMTLTRHFSNLYISAHCTHN